MGEFWLEMREREEEFSLDVFTLKILALSNFHWFQLISSCETANKRGLLNFG